MKLFVPTISPQIESNGASRHDHLRRATGILLDSGHTPASEDLAYCSSTGLAISCPGQRAIHTDRRRLSFVDSR